MADDFEVRIQRINVPYARSTKDPYWLKGHNLPHSIGALCEVLDNKTYKRFINNCIRDLPELVDELGECIDRWAANYKKAVLEVIASGTYDATTLAKEFQTGPSLQGPPGTAGIPAPYVKIGGVDAEKVPYPKGGLKFTHADPLRRYIPMNQGRYEFLKRQGWLRGHQEIIGVKNMRIISWYHTRYFQGWHDLQIPHTPIAQKPGPRLDPLGQLSNMLYEGVNGSQIHTVRQGNGFYISWRIHNPMYIQRVHEGHAGYRGIPALPRPFLDVVAWHQVPILYGSFVNWMEMVLQKKIRDNGERQPAVFRTFHGGGVSVPGTERIYMAAPRTGRLKPTSALDIGLIRKPRPSGFSVFDGDVSEQTPQEKAMFGRNNAQKGNYRYNRFNDTVRVRRKIPRRKVGKETREMTIHHPTPYIKYHESKGRYGEGRVSATRENLSAKQKRAEADQRLRDMGMRIRNIEDQAVSYRDRSGRFMGKRKEPIGPEIALREARQQRATEIEEEIGKILLDSKGRNELSEEKTVEMLALVAEGGMLREKGARFGSTGIKDAVTKIKRQQRANKKPRPLNYKPKNLGQGKYGYRKGTRRRKSTKRSSRRKKRK